MADRAVGMGIDIEASCVDTNSIWWRFRALVQVKHLLMRKPCIWRVTQEKILYC